MTSVVSDTPSASHSRAAAPARWVPVCRLDELIPGRGVAALLDLDLDLATAGSAGLAGLAGSAGSAQLQAAVFRTAVGELHAVGNLDPFTGACVISRGLLGSRDGSPTVASPMLKHVFELRTGFCVDGPAGAQPGALPVYPVRCPEGIVEVGVPDHSEPREETKQ